MRIVKPVNKFLLNLLFPNFCLGCGSEGDYLCSECRGLIDINYYSYCPVCNCRVLDSRVCLKCRGKIKLFGLFWAVDYRNTLVKKLFSRLKYEARVRDISRILAGFVIDSFAQLHQAASPFSTAPPHLAAFGGRERWILIPVPLHKKKLKKRGFNQAEEIAKELAQVWDIPLLSDVLIKTRETISQTKLDKEQRAENVKGAFRVDLPKFCEAKLGQARILLVDDVYTTGSTMNECARVLKEAGIKQVWGIAVARE